MPKIKYVGRLYENTYRINLHTHDFWEIVRYTKGSGLVEIDGEIIPFQENDIFAIPPNVPHTDYSDTGFQNYHYTFNDDDFNRLSYMKFQDTENNDFLTIMAQLYHEYHLKRKNYQNIIDSLYTVLFHYILALSEEAESNQYVAFVINEIISNISNPDYEIQQTLQKVPLTEDYFRKLFFQETGKTPLQYLTQKRISYAKQLLCLQAHSGISIQEIAWRSGFADNYYFSRVFKKVTGVSPKYWAECDKQKAEEDNELPKRNYLPPETKDYE
ncbi:MAG TPA: helix-turn-helix domain-containing protein [Candidatus Egerieisoma faecipullorum]|uniref:Helix-turn-helix domain-containing protein n=1 Tax=Candidatus Egerieisoma faecipullorum TaxID=2840963 RepID=A0A9D1LAY9_9CLOT|nr:helix-turn-helix domain-containing protein [Candidatus Egerieisoma faecipullorum]